MALLLQGCLARAAVDVASVPVKVVSQAADWATTSQDEADRNRGREIRLREERLGKLKRNQARYARRCERGSAKACRRVEDMQRGIDRLQPGVPQEPAGDRG